MDSQQLLLPYQGQPITHQLLTSLLKDYRRPNDKIKALMDEGVLQSVKRGIYIPGSATTAAKPERELLANHLYGPSCLSLDTALSHYGLIPERVYAVTSVTTKASRKFNTPIGLYTYTHLPLPYYAFGLTTALLNKNQQAIIASPEKALADKVVATKGVLLRSVNSAMSYLLEDLRMDELDLKSFDTAAMATWMADAPKKESLEMVVKAIVKL